MRCFFAVELPDDVRGMLASLAVEAAIAVGRDGISCKPVDERNLHITIRFLGEVDKGQALSMAEGPLRQVVSGIPEFGVRIRGVGAFPTHRRPRVIWAGLDEGSDALSALRWAVDRSLAARGFILPEESYKPHITLLRVKEGTVGGSGLTELTRWLSDNSGRLLGGFGANSITLYESKLHHDGPSYFPIVRFALAGGRR